MLGRRRIFGRDGSRSCSLGMEAGPVYGFLSCLFFSRSRLSCGLGCHDCALPIIEKLRTLRREEENFKGTSRPSNLTSNQLTFELVDEFVHEIYCGINRSIVEEECGQGVSKV